MEHSAEWLRGAVAVIGRMVDECQTVFDSDLPHITQGNLEDYLAEYAELLAAAEAREAALEKHEIAAYLEWQGKDGIKCGTFQPSEEGPREPTYTTTVREWRKLVARAEAHEATQPSAAEVIRVAIQKAYWISGSPHEWPTVYDIPLLCQALINSHNLNGSAKTVIETCKKIITLDLQNVEDEGSINTLTEALAAIAAYEASNDR